MVKNKEYCKKKYSDFMNQSLITLKVIAFQIREITLGID